MGIFRSSVSPLPLLPFLVPGLVVQKEEVGFVIGEDPA